MAALYSHTTRATGLTLTAAIYNADHQNHITNGVPLMLDDYSSNASEMQSTADPGESGTESLATTLAGEIERLRFAILEMKQRFDPTLSYWYQTANAGDNSGRAPLPPKFIDGFNLTVTGKWITVGDGWARSQDDLINLKVSTALHRSVSSTWVTAATGGGMGVTLPAVRTYFHVFVFKTAASTFDIGFDTVLSASNLMARASATHYRRVGSVQGATVLGNVRPQYSIDGHVVYSTGVAAANDILGNPTWWFNGASGAVQSLVRVPGIPSGFAVQARIRTAASENCGQYAVMNAGQGGGFLYSMLCHPTIAENWEVWTNVSGEVIFVNGGGGGTTQVRGVALGYFDPRKV